MDDYLEGGMECLSVVREGEKERHILIVEDGWELFLMAVNQAGYN